MSNTEATPLTEDTTSRIFYVQDNNRFYSRRRREQRLQWLTFAVSLVIFTMALIVTIGFSLNLRNKNDTPPELDIDQTPTLEMTFPKDPWAPSSGSTNIDPLNSKTNSEKQLSTISKIERSEGIKAGNMAKEARLLADEAALATPLPSPSPASRHHYAVSTSPAVGAMALAATAEIAATKKIETTRSLNGKDSSFGTYFDGGWVPKDSCKEFVQPTCELNSKYRTYDGSCNRPKQWGASMIPYRRSIPPDYADGIDKPRTGYMGADLPTAREISLRVHPPASSNNPDFTVMLAVFGQFLDHDMTATALNQGINGSSISCCAPGIRHPECFPVPVGQGDPVYDVAGKNCMEFIRSAPAPQCKLGPREQLNQVSAFIDGSTIYGADPRAAYNLREGIGGRLRMQQTPDNRTLLPSSNNPNDGCNRELELERGRYCFAAGDARANENLHLTTMHLIWARQHNRIADRLAQLNPTWNDEILYQETRRIVGAQIQHITYNEFVPIVLGEQLIKDRNLKPLDFGYREYDYSFDELINDPSIGNNFASAAFRFAHTLLPGLMRFTDTQKGTSSFIELHKMLFNPYSLYSENGVRNSVTSATSNNIQMTSTHVTSQLTRHLFEDPMSNITVPCGLDLVSLNIQRGRDHGIPGYTSWREFCGLGTVTSFADLDSHMDPQSLKEISALYKSVNDVDLYTGALAEIPVSGGLVGPTFDCLIADQFGRLQKGDRFWYEVPGQPHSFDQDQLQEIRKTSLAKVLCDCSDGIGQIQANVMKTMNPKNPMILCEDIIGPSWEAWKEDSINSMLKSIPTPIDWVQFKTNINQTVNDIIKFVNSTKNNISIDTDWLTFRDNVNKSFSDIKGQLNDLLSPTESASLKSSLNSSMIYQDWINFKFKISKWINDTIADTGSGIPDTKQWTAFKSEIKDRLDDIKSEIGLLKSDIEAEKMKDGTFMNKKLTLMSSAGVYDWWSVKDKIINSINDTINDINAKKPLSPFDPAWSTFGDAMKDRYAAMRDKINNDKFNTPIEKSTGDWMNYQNDIINIINDTIGTIKDEMPLANDSASWLLYKDQIKSKFSQFKDKIAWKKNSTINDFMSKKFPKLTLSEKEDTESMTDWINYKNDIMNIINDTIESIKDGMPLANDSASWLIYKDQMKSKFLQLRDKIAWKKNSTINDFMSKKFPKLTLSEKEDTESMTDWTNYKNDIMNIINDTIESVKDGMPLANDSASWLAYKDQMKSKFSQLRDNIAWKKNSTLKLTSTETEDTERMTDWFNFRNKINDSLNGILSDINNKKLPSVNNSMALLAFENSLKQQFSELNDQIDKLRSELLFKYPNNKPLKITMKKDVDLIPNTDWMDFKNNINDTVTSIIKSIKNNVTIDWTDVRQTFNKSAMDLKSKIISIRNVLSNGTSPHPIKVTKSSVIRTNVDWSEMQEKINFTLNNLENIVEKKNVTPIDELISSLMNIKNEFANLKPSFVSKNLSLTADTNGASNSVPIYYYFFNVFLIYVIFSTC